MIENDFNTKFVELHHIGQQFYKFQTIKRWSMIQYITFW